jgi:hypothetical protein
MEGYAQRLGGAFDGDQWRCHNNIVYNIYFVFWEGWGGLKGRWRGYYYDSFRPPKK